LTAFRAKIANDKESHGLRATVLHCIKVEYDRLQKLGFN